MDYANLERAKDSSPTTLSKLATSIEASKDKSPAQKDFVRRELMEIIRHTQGKNGATAESQDNYQKVIDITDNALSSYHRGSQGSSASSHSLRKARENLSLYKGTPSRKEERAQIHAQHQPPSHDEPTPEKKEILGSLHEFLENSSVLSPQEVKELKERASNAHASSQKSSLLGQPPPSAEGSHSHHKSERVSLDPELELLRREYQERHKRALAESYSPPKESITAGEDSIDLKTFNDSYRLPPHTLLDLHKRQSPPRERTTPPPVANEMSGSDASHIRRTLLSEAELLQSEIDNVAAAREEEREKERRKRSIGSLRRNVVTPPESPAPKAKPSTYTVRTPTQSPIPSPILAHEDEKIADSYNSPPKSPLKEEALHEPLVLTTGKPTTVTNVVASVMMTIVTVCMSTCHACFAFSDHQLIPFVHVALGLAFLSTAVFALFSAFTNTSVFSVATISHVPLLFLQMGLCHLSVQIDDRTELLSTSLMFVATYTVFVGVTCAVLSTVFHTMFCFLPHVVLATLMSYVALLALRLSCEVAVGLKHPGVWSWDSVADDDSDLYGEVSWIGPAMLGLCIVVAVLLLVVPRLNGWNHSPFVFAVTLAVPIIIFWIVIAAIGVPPKDDTNVMYPNRDLQMFFSVWESLSTSSISWRLLLQEWQLYLSGAILAALFSSLNLSGLEVVASQDVDIERELKFVGLANIGSGIVGGFPGSVDHRMTSWGWALTRGSKIPSYVMSVVCLALFFSGPVQVERLLPRFVVGGVFAAFGIQMAKEWLYAAFFRVSNGQFAVLLIVVVAGFFFGPWLLIQLCVICAFHFLLSHQAQRGPIQRQGSLFHWSTRFQSSVMNDQLLTTVGSRAQVMELRGFMWYGVVQELKSQIVLFLERRPDITHVLLDGGLVTGVDATASHPLNRLVHHAASKGVQIVFTRFPDDMHSLLFAANLVVTPNQALQKIEEADQPSSDALVLKQHTQDSKGAIQGVYFKDLRSALEYCENRVLSNDHRVPREFTDCTSSIPNFSLFLKKVFVGLQFEDSSSDHMFAKLAAVAEYSTVQPGHLFYSRQDPPAAIFFIESGQVEVECDTSRAGEKVVSVFAHGSLFGIHEFFSGTKRRGYAKAKSVANVYRVTQLGLMQIEREDPTVALGLAYLLLNWVCRTDQRALYQPINDQ